jgi:hypothetical protein
MTALAPAFGENLATSIASGPSGGAPPMSVDEVRIIVIPNRNARFSS